MKDLTGIRFGRLIVLGLHHKKQRYNKNKTKAGHQYFWLCKCDCGNETIVLGDNLKKGNTQSCGCIHKEVTTKHNLCNTRLYSIWHKMIDRCKNSNNTYYHCYGGRGIKVCDEWKEFKNFYIWAIKNGYTDNLSIDRINNNDNYKPTNCRWADNKTQSRNRRTNKYITFNNETHCLIEWAEILNIKYKTLNNRLLRGWEIERAFNARK